MSEQSLLHMRGHAVCDRPYDRYTITQVNTALQPLDGSVDAAPVGQGNIRLWLQAWKQGYDASWQAFGGDPCLPGTGNRKCATHTAYFKQADDISFKHLPKYLCAGLQLPRDVVRSMAQFRLGCHPLRVERGRYTRLTYEQRVCLRCNNGLIDNEHHMLFECKSFDSFRQHQRFKHLFQGPSCVRSFMSQDDYISVACFVHSCVSHVKSLDA